MDERLAVVGNRIKLLRMAKGVPQTELSEKVGISQTNLSNIEHGRTAATVANLFKISEVLNCKLADFFVDFDGEPNDKKEFSLNELQDAVKVLQMLREAK